MTSEANHYELLGIPREATPEEVRSAYHAAALRLHPDVNREAGDTELFMRIQVAYQVLSDPDQRATYDRIHPAPAEKHLPVSLSTHYSRSQVPRLDESQLVYTILDLTVAANESKQSKLPLNICLVIDRSTSMQGERLETVKKAAISLLRQFRREDWFSIIAFSDRAEVILPAGRYGNLQAAEEKIFLLKTSGGTEILPALEAGYTEVYRNLNRKSINHILLLTDGRTYGDEEDCLHLADKAAGQGIRITALGIGEEWNDAFLDDLAVRTGGSSQYIARVSDIPEYFQQRIADFNSVFADNVVLDVSVVKGVTLNGAFRLQPEAVHLPVGSSMRLGRINYQMTLSVLLEFIVEPLPVQETQVVLAAGEIDMHVHARGGELHRVPIRLTRPVADGFIHEAPSARIMRAMSYVTLYRMQQQARQEVQEGKTEAASLRLQHMATCLIHNGERHLAQTALMEAERVRLTGSISLEGEKRIKYGTRARWYDEPVTERSK